MTGDLFGTGPEYRCTLADPGWAEKGGGQIKRGADKHYTVEGKLGDVEPHYRMIVDSGMWRPAADSHFWCWVTDNFLEDGLALIRRLGFVYKRTFVWVKTTQGADLEADEPDVRFGIGQYGRGAHELLLFSTHGKGQSSDAWTGDRSVPSVFHAPNPSVSGKRIHSRKPPKSYEVIERVSRGPRLEFNCRVARDGWARHGNEAPLDFTGEGRR